jgi:hypothetical protein
VVAGSVWITKNKMGDTPQTADVFQPNNPFASRPPSVVDIRLVDDSADHSLEFQAADQYTAELFIHDICDNDVDVVAFEWTKLADAQTLQRYSTFDLNPGLKAIVI